MTLLFSSSIILFLVGAVASLIFSPKPHISRFISYASAFIGSLCAAIFSLLLLIEKTNYTVSLITFFNFPILSFSIDALGAFFIFLVSVIGIAVSLFSFSYAEHYEEKYSTWLLGFLYNTFICSMILVLASDSVITFLIMWELMSLLSYFLVIYEYNKTSSLKAGFLYLVMTHIGTVFLATAFFLLYKVTGSFQFSDFHTLIENVPQFTRDIIFVLAFIGFGSKAGVVPFHIWLPEAHPAAPSHISALMSGVMIKIAIYGIVRIVFDLLGGSIEIWWGSLVLIIGTLSAIIGALYSLMQHDLKRLLAYSSVENIGIILMGIGSGMLFISTGHPELAAIALLAGLFHTLNHALFKSLLFLGAGSIHKAVGILNIEKLGGLASKMPFTAITFLIGSMAISALPLFNGFISEWLVFQGLLGNMTITNHIFVQVVVGLSVALLALTSALALSCFARAYSITFLALPRSSEASQAKESSLGAIIGMIFLAVTCIVLGVFPFLATNIIIPVISAIHIPSSSIYADASIMSVTQTSGIIQNSITPLWIVIMFFIILALAWGVVRLLWGKHKKRIAPTWACGRSVESRMEYTGSGLAMPFKLIFSGLYRPTHNIEKETLSGSTYLISSIKYEEKIEPLFEIYIYDPISKLALWIGNNARKIQTGNLNMYLLYIFMTLIVLLYIFV